MKMLETFDVLDLDAVAVTGRNFRNSVSLTSISEPEAIESALRGEYREGEMPDLVLSAGGETHLVYSIDPKGAIISVRSGTNAHRAPANFFCSRYDGWA